MKQRYLVVATLLGLFIALMAASCSGGGNPLPPAASVLLAIAHGANNARVYGPAGSADAASTVSITAGGTGTAIAAVDGSFTLEATGSGIAGTSMTVSYTKQGTAFDTAVVLRSQTGQVDNSLFATGAAPNDIAYAGSSLFVANSLDNTVVKHDLSGASLATHSFAQFAGPSFLAAQGNAVWVVCNGTNTVTGLREADLSPLAGAEFALDATGYAFLGPAAPVVTGTFVYVPCNGIAAFGSPTDYGQASVRLCDIGAGSVGSIATAGKNAGYAAFDSARGLLYVVCTGEIQFDANFVPHAAGKSFVEIYDVNAANTRIGSIDLGLAGAQRIALSSNGEVAYLTNALTAALYKLDLAGRTVLRGPGDPIELTGEFSYSSDAQFTPDGRWLLATSFNTDELFVVDPSTDTINPGPYPTPFNLDGNSNLLAGAQRMAIGPASSADTSARVYIVLGVANAVASVDLY